MLTRQELKQRAKEQIRGNIGISLLCLLIFLLIYMGLGGIPFLSLITIWALIFILPALSLGLVKVYMAMSYGDTPDISTLFSGFGQFWQALLTFLLLCIPSFIYALLTLLPLLIIVLSAFTPVGTGDLLVNDVFLNALPLYLIWAFFLYILALYVFLGFSMIFFILAENPELSALDVVKASWQMMKGRRWNFIVFRLSFILWFFLGSITFGLAYIYVIPYVCVATANYYHNIKANQNVFSVTEGGSAAQTFIAREVPLTATAEEIPAQEVPVIDASPAAEEITKSIEEVPASESVEEPSTPEEASEIAIETSPSVSDKEEDEDEEWSWDKLIQK